MAEALHSIGRPENLQLDLRWSDSVEHPLGYGSLTVWVAGHLIWGHRNDDGEIIGIEWFWDDLLERLALTWRYLLLEESYPMGLVPLAPQLLRGILRERRIGTSDEIANAEDNAVYVFEEMHDLSRATEGATLPQLFLLREGKFMLVATTHGVERVSFSHAIDALETLGDKIAERVGGKTDPRTRAILDAWKGRELVPSIDQVEISSGLPKSTITAITQASDFNTFWEIQQNQPNELLAAARMVGRLASNEDTRAILDRIKAAPKTETPLLDKLSAEATRELDKLKSRMPNEQGRLLAEWLRSRPGIVAKDGLVYPDEILKKWSVSLTEIELRSQNIEALCAWGTRHGPVVLLNRNGLLSHYPTGRRSSLAHEICHLLVDRNGSLPVAEVFGGEVPKLPEQRANAFGAELLLTRNSAQVAFARLQNVEEALKQLATTYNVSFEVAAWQLLNSRAELSSSQRAELLKHTFRYAA